MLKYDLKIFLLSFVKNQKMGKSFAYLLKKLLFKRYAKTFFLSFQRRDKILGRCLRKVVKKFLPTLRKHATWTLEIAYLI